MSSRSWCRNSLTWWSEDPAQHEDGQGDARLAQGDALLHERHAQAGRALRLQVPRHRHQSVPVGIGLDDRHHRHARVRLNRAQIVGDRIEVDADSGRALGEGGGHAGFLDPVRQRAGAGIQPILAALPRD